MPLPIDSISDKISHLVIRGATSPTVAFNILIHSFIAPLRTNIWFFSNIGSIYKLNHPLTMSFHFYISFAFYSTGNIKWKGLKWKEIPITLEYTFYVGSLYGVWAVFDRHEL